MDFKDRMLIMNMSLNKTQMREKIINELGSDYCMYGKSNAVHKICDTIQKIARVDSTVLITGESGTGKELVANAVHAASKRSHGPFIKINCTALNDNLLESELFGHVRGAFTGAVSDKIGKFEAASGGTIFLDEIGDISALMQAKLLRIIQERKFERVGENKTRECDVRIIAATHRNLPELVKTEKFRHDLYYRLNVVSLYLPSLKERPEDIPALVNYFINKFNKKENTNIIGVSDEVMEKLQNYSWPGNVRELENIIEESCVMTDSAVIDFIRMPQAHSDGAKPDSKKPSFIMYGKGLMNYNNGMFSNANRVIRGVSETISDNVEGGPDKSFVKNSIGDSGYINENFKADMNDGTKIMKIRPLYDESAEIPSVNIKMPCTLSEAEKILIEKTLSMTNNNKTRAAKLLGISLRSLQLKLKR